MEFKATGLVTRSQYYFFDNFTRNYESGKQTDVILMDIAKAFDTAPHNRLRLKLQWYSMAGNAYQWISSFFTTKE